MKGRPIDALVYEQMFKSSKLGDCQNFNALLQRQLVPEVRLETAAFYGSLESKEAQYPGLDYSHPPHRMRLGRFPWHRRLFRAFDNLGLTKAEIASLTKWEGTRWAKERYEKENGVTIEDTTGKEIQHWVEPMPKDPQTIREGLEIEVEEMEDVSEETEEEELEEDDNNAENDVAEDESDVETESFGIELNERLRARVAERLDGVESVSMDEQWEQWMKEISESGDADLAQSAMATRSASNHFRPPRIWAEQLSYPAGARQVPDGHRTRTPIPAPSFPNSFTPASMPIPASIRRSSSTTVPILPSRSLSWARIQPQQAQPPRS